MKAIAVVAVLLVAYAQADVTELTQAQVDALSAEETNAITQEQWSTIFNRWCSPLFASYAKSQYLADRVNCHYFYECVGYKAVRMQCAADLFWNPTLNTCDYKYRAGCSCGCGGAGNKPTSGQPAKTTPSQQAVPNQNLPIQQGAVPNQHLPIQPAGTNDNGAIEIPIANNPVVVDPY
ncbi:uncharacterized protein LOC134530578 [Bacillus rossius redtenbacheri]|uniref:uncharacterized protein LOC134530578 n=1 Tax=Bacillus rossius redtenbacheri TaxID=93214 RepID=UPI002FDDB433